MPPGWPHPPAARSTSQTRGTTSSTEPSPCSLPAPPCQPLHPPEHPGGDPPVLGLHPTPQGTGQGDSRRPDPGRPVEPQGAPESNSWTLASVLGRRDISREER